MPFSNKKIGIIGASQLSIYLAKEARQMGYPVIGLSEKKTDPAVPWFEKWMSGRATRWQDINKLSVLCRTVIFENKSHLGSETLGRIDAEKIFPRVQLNIKLNDLWTQKELFYDFDVAQVPFIKVNGKDDLDAGFEFFKKTMVLKNRFEIKNKVDTFIIKNQAQLSSFKAQYKGREGHFIIEPFVALESEHRLIIARNHDGEFSIYPLFTVVTIDGDYDYTHTTVHPQMTAENESLIIQLKNLMTGISYVGLATFSLFFYNGKLLVTEMNARPTNAGMITLTGFNVNQFELHIRSLLNHRLPPILSRNEIVLCKYLNGTSRLVPRFVSHPTGRLFWYSKKQNRPGRKMGHINYTGFDLRSLLRTAQNERKKILI